ncbi:MAG: diguanylate cyclase [Solirubrobacteraceae bacterium]|nr:diguanylate cyclase [Solirubrobacteraceae bacterium]
MDAYEPRNGANRRRTRRAFGLLAVILIPLGFAILLASGVGDELVRQRTIADRETASQSRAGQAAADMAQWQMAANAAAVLSTGARRPERAKELWARASRSDSAAVGRLRAATGDTPNARVARAALREYEARVGLMRRERWTPARLLAVSEAAGKSAVALRAVERDAAVRAKDARANADQDQDNIVLGAALMFCLLAWGMVGVSRWQQRRHQRVLRNLASHDALTGLGNRRALETAMEAAFSPGASPALLTIHDLDGFKRYNDLLGHPAGDALLVRLGERLRAAVEPRGLAFRLGGDEFCTIVPDESALVRARTALRDESDGVRVSASAGTIRLPSDAHTSTDALRLADQRLYADKAANRPSADDQVRDIALAVLAAVHPDTHAHGTGVGELAGAVADELELSVHDRSEVVMGATLHDIGKAGIAASIIDKEGPLDDEEWAAIRTHTILGERILGAAGPLAPVGRIVRGSHERWDGGGYPDGLSGEDIPLGSRIIFACDAWSAMTEDRPYRSALMREEALAELRDGAGSQFDPRVVDALQKVIAAASPVAS